MFKKPNQTSNLLIEVAIWLFLLLSGVSITSPSSLLLSTPSPISCFYVYAYLSPYPFPLCFTPHPQKRGRNQKGQIQEEAGNRVRSAVTERRVKIKKEWIFLVLTKEKTPPPTKNTHTTHSCCPCVVLLRVNLYAKQKDATLKRGLGGKIKKELVICFITKWSFHFTEILY